MLNTTAFANVRLTNVTGHFDMCNADITTMTSSTFTCLQMAPIMGRGGGEFQCGGSEGGGKNADMALNLYMMWDPVKMTRNKVVYYNKNSMAAMGSV